MRITTICAALAMTGAASTGVSAQTGRTAPVPDATATPAAAEHAINTKGTGTRNCRAAAAAPADHAINTKGTGGVNGRAPAPADPATVCDATPESGTPRP